MADTKISALTAVATPAGTDQYATNQGGTSKRTTLAQVMAFVNTAPVWAAGTASAGTWPTFTAGTLLTAQVSGTWEYDGNAAYFTAGGNRGVLAAESIITLTSNFTTPGGTITLQKLFNSPTNGAITLAANTAYEFEAYFKLASMSATSGAFGFGFGGSVGIASVDYASVALKNVANTAGLPPDFVAGTLALSTWLVNSNTQTSGFAHIKGKLVTSTAGTLIPSFATSIAAATVVGAGSYFKIKPLGADTVQSVGNWS
jgi:hypothetical protein